MAAPLSGWPGDQDQGVCREGDLMADKSPRWPYEEFRINGRVVALDLGGDDRTKYGRARDQWWKLNPPNPYTQLVTDNALIAELDTAAKELGSFNIRAERAIESYDHVSCLEAAGLI